MRTAIKKLLSILTVGILFTLVATNPVGAQSAADPDVKLLEQLLLNIPEESDNPNFSITFTDPSGKGVFLSIDGAQFEQITNPYVLPSLGIGKHNLNFKFSDKEETEHQVDKDLIIVPRPPVIQAPEIIDTTKLQIRGTSLALSKVSIFVAGEESNYRQIVETDSTGNWEYIFEDQFKEGTYTLIALTKKAGYSSSISEPIKFSIEVGATQDQTEDQSTPVISFRFDQLRELSPSQLRDVVSANPDIFLLAVALLAFGFIFGVWINSSYSGFKNRSDENMFRTLLARREAERKERGVVDSSKGMNSKVTTKESLKTKFEAAGFKGKSKAAQSESEEVRESVKKDEPDSKPAVDQPSTPAQKEEKQEAEPEIVVEKREGSNVPHISLKDIAGTNVHTKPDQKDMQDQQVEEKELTDEESKNEPTLKQISTEEKGGIKGKLKSYFGRSEGKSEEAAEEEPVKDDLSRISDSALVEISKEEFMQRYKKFDPDVEPEIDLKKGSKKVSTESKSKTKKSSSKKDRAKTNGKNSNGSIKITLTGKDIAKS